MKRVNICGGVAPLLLLACAVAPAWERANAQAIKATYHELWTSKGLDGTVLHSREVWGKYYRSASGSTLTIYLSPSTGAPSTANLYDALAGETYQIQYVKNIFMKFPHSGPPAGMVLASPGTAPPPLQLKSNQPVQTINGVQCVVIPVKGPQITTGSACYSPQFQITVRNDSTAERDNQVISNLTEYIDLSVDTEEHDPTFFQLPPGLTEVQPQNAANAPSAAKHY